MTPASNFLVQSSFGPGRYVGFFEQTDGSEEETPSGGFLYVSDDCENRIIRAMGIYKTPLHIQENDVRVHWSTNGKKCGVEIWGRMRGIIDLETEDQIHTDVKDPQSPAVTDQKWLAGFDRYLDQHQFIRARQRFWRTEARYRDTRIAFEHEFETPTSTNFLAYERGPDDLFAVFEDDGSSGYLYLYDSKKGEIAEYVHNYDRSAKLLVNFEDVEVAWSEDGQKCGVIILRKMRGIIDRERPSPGRVWMDAYDSPGIADKGWLKGFEYLFS
jgi:hypothetical protein